MAYWTCTASVTERCLVTVEAETEEEAIEKFNACEWEDGSAENGEIVDYEIVGRFKKDEE